MKSIKSTLFKEIEQVVKRFNPETIPLECKGDLQSLIYYIQSKVSSNQETRIKFICTNNSRRSHFAQVWAQTLAYYFKVKNVFCYSGGTEVTALFPMVAQTLVHSGFKIKIISQNRNPVYSIKYADNEHPIIGFSKRMDNDFKDRKSTRLNSSHVATSYAVFCLKKNKALL